MGTMRNASFPDTVRKNVNSSNKNGKYLDYGYT